MVKLNQINMLKLLLCLLSLSFVMCSENSVLDNLDINPDTLSVSGFSSGGAFANQLHIAFSKSVRTQTKKSILKIQRNDSQLTFLYR